MQEKTVEVEALLVLPDLEDETDECLVRFRDALQARKGIVHVHLARDQEPLRVCIHYDPRRVSLEAVRRTAQQVGGQLMARYHHARIPFAGMRQADEAPALRRALERLPGMLHADVNYAAGLAFVAYDREVLSPQQIAAAMQALNIQPLDWPPLEDAAEHDHGNAPAFLPHWVQERWELLLVGLAGAFLVAGWVGQTFLGLPEPVAVTLFLLAYAAGGYDIATHALPGLFRGHFDTDVLMLAAAAGAAVLGQWAEGAFLLFLFGLGHAGEHYALDRARHAVNALGALMPKVAHVREGERVVERPVAQLKPGDRVIVRPGDRVPVDGEVIAGQSAVDQSPITGESVPVPKKPGDEVFAGTINHAAVLEIEVTRHAQDTTLARIMRLVAEAQSQQSPTQRFVEKFTARFVPAVLLFVLAVVFVPPLVGWMPLRVSFYRGMLLLVAASPCALALGTPATVLAGIAQAARHGVLIKGGVHLENLGALQVMAFDKTGTLTEGKFRLTDVLPLEGVSAETLLRVAAAVEQSANHPLAVAVVQAARQRGVDLPLAVQVENISGRGVRGKLAGEPVWVGSLRLFREIDAQPPARAVAEKVAALEAEGKTTMVVRAGARYLGVLALADAPRPGVQATLRALRDLGIRKLVMLTGDNPTVAQRIAEEVGVTDVRAGLLPEQKLEAIRELQAGHGAVAMVGDGVNDAPALATATVGIAMGGAGTAVALETADVALMADDLSQLPFAVGLSRASRAVIRQNLAISLGVIFLLLATSVFGWMDLGGAVVLHEGSSILVVLNALRLLRFTAS